MIELESIEAIAEVFGSHAALARCMKRKPSAVSNWKARGAIPAFLRNKLDRILERKGYVVDPSLYTRDWFASGQTR